MRPSSELAVELRVALPPDVALHARPAGVLVREAAGLPGTVIVSANGRRARASSILEVLALGAEGGTELLLTGSGDGAAETVERLAALVRRLA